MKVRAAAETAAVIYGLLTFWAGILHLVIYRDAMETLQAVAAWAGPLWTIFSPLLFPALIYGLWAGIAELRKRGYKATYAAAIVRALGEGYNAAQAAGVSPFTDAGKRLVATAGAKYLTDTVQAEATALGITTAEQHGKRVVAQLGVEALRAAASAAPAPGVLIPPLPTDKVADLRSALAEAEAAGQGVLEGLLPAAKPA